MFTVAGHSMEKKNLDDNSKFKLIIWDNVEDITDIQTLSYRELTSRYIPFSILSDKYIAKYYWDEQLIEYEYDRLQESPVENFSLSNGFFSIVLDNKIILHGLSRMIDLSPIKSEYDDRNFPVILLRRCSHQGNWILALKPRYYPKGSLFRDYDEEDQKGLLNQEVLKYFEAQGKIVRGKMDLNKLFGRSGIEGQSVKK